MAKRFLDQHFAPQSPFDIRYITVRGITGVGQVIGFVAFIINAQNDEFDPYRAKQASTLLAALLEQKGWVVDQLPPQRVAVPGDLRPWFIPKLHVLGDAGEFSGIVIFDFKGDFYGLQADDGSIIKLA